MLKLDRKLIRDLMQMKGQVVAIVLVIAAGVATFVMSMCSYASLATSKDSFYREFRFADVFSSARRVPDTMLPRIAQISGVASVEARIVDDVLLDVPEMADPATARLISVPEHGDAVLNKLYIARGRMLEAGRTGEVVVSEVFADAHGFVAGDTVDAIINGRRQTLKIVGVALSPEYVIQVQPGSIMPDNKRFGVFWINQRDLEAALDMTGAFNSVTLKLAYDSNADEVIDQLDRLLKPYGSVGAYDRDQQISHQFLSDEMAQLRSTAIMAPAIFLSVAAFLLNIVISRIIAQQREQIAALKAFGYTHVEVGLHYLHMVLVISLTGTVIGAGLGFWMSANIVHLYEEFYKFPQLEFQVDWLAIALAFLLTTAAALIGTWLSVREVIALPPAEAMRPAPPANYRPTLIERIVPAGSLPSEVRMVIRNVARKPLKASLSILGIAMAVAVMIVGNFSLDSINYMMDFQFRLAQRQDISVTFVEPATASVVYEVSRLPGVQESETMRSVAAEVKFQNRSRRVGILGLQHDPQLYRLLDSSEQVVQVPDFGIMLNSKLADLLGARPGDLVTLEILEDKRPTVEIEVTAIVEEYTGVNAYMNKQQLHKLLKESEVASGAYLKVDSSRLQDVFRELEQRPGVGSVAIKLAVLESFNETVAKNILVMRSFIIMFAAVIAIGVVYNSARISLSERSRDLATMRVVGFTRREVSIVLLGEIGLFTVCAIPIGCLLGYALAGVMAAGLDTDNYRIPLVVSRETFALAAMVVVVATFLSGLIVQRRINELDLVAVLKMRE
ncbi:ABC transporter permease [Rosistilla oblonga]|uniref:FtsX-like permease family protein n=1 Tax=Rosistilla oblonga TaxID=2527990 RepID=A0A518IYK4_9BACT|nr:FtsX-like permease family protein [Rosistilla oblonga]QDV58170.1 FtsX-like permease family protein [Rosistilla oblonga]